MGLLCDILENMKKNDMILAAVLLALALVTGGAYYGMHRSPAAYAEVSVDGTVVEKLDLTVDREYTVESADGGVNRLVVEDGSVWCEEANCPERALCPAGEAEPGRERHRLPAAPDDCENNRGGG